MGTTRGRRLAAALGAAATCAVAACGLCRLRVRATVGTTATGSIDDGLSMIGDSLTDDCIADHERALAAAGWPRSTIDARGGRGVARNVTRSRHTGLRVVDAMRRSSGDTRHWVVALGTNDVRVVAPERYATTIARMLERIGPGHRVLWVNIHLPHDEQRQLAWNTALATAALERPDQLLVFDWATAAAAHPEWLAPDGIHHTAAGHAARSAAVAQASLALSAKPARSDAAGRRPVEE